MQSNIFFIILLNSLSMTLKELVPVGFPHFQSNKNLRSGRSMDLDGIDVLKILAYLHPYIPNQLTQHSSQHVMIRMISQNTCFLWPIYSHMGTESTILSLYGNMRIGEKPIFWHIFTQWLKYLVNVTSMSLMKIYYKNCCKNDLLNFS